MKLRSILPLLALVLLTGSLAGAAMAAPAPPVAAAVASPVVASPLCLAQASKAGLPAGNPGVAKSTQLCGACSDLRCANNTLGNTCASGGYTCQNVFGNFCSQDGLSQCTCTNRPPF